MARAQHHEAERRLAPFIVRDADDATVEHRGVLLEYRLDVGGKDVLAAGEDHVLLAVDDEKIAILVEPAEVAGAQPGPPFRVVPQRLGGGLVAVVVTAHHEARPADDLTGFARGQFAAGLVDDPEVGARHRLADRGRLRQHVLRVERGDDALGQPIEFDQPAAELGGDPPLQVDVHRRADRAHVLHGAHVAMPEGGVLDHLLELQRHHGDMRAAVLLDFGEEFRRLEVLHHHDGAAGEEAAQHRQPADVGEQSHRADRHGAGVVAQRYADVIGPLEAPAMAVDDALG